MMSELYTDLQDMKADLVRQRKHYPEYPDDNHDKYMAAKIEGQQELLDEIIQMVVDANA